MPLKQKLPVGRNEDAMKGRGGPGPARGDVLYPVSPGSNTGLRAGGAAQLESVRRRLDWGLQASSLIERPPHLGTAARGPQEVAGGGNAENYWD